MTIFTADLELEARGAYALGRVQGACNQIVELIEAGTLKLRFEASPRVLVKHTLLGDKVVGSIYSIHVEGRDKRHVDAVFAALVAQATR